MKRSPAYTLIEVLIVVTILGIVAVPGFFIYWRSSANQRLKASAEIFTNHLRQARTFSRDGRSGGPSSLSSSWGIVVKSDDVSYDLMSQNATDPGVTTEESYRLQDGITITSPADPQVWFAKLSGDALMTYTIELSNKYGQKYGVEIFKTGVMEVKPL